MVLVCVMCQAEMGHEGRCASVPAGWEVKARQLATSIGCAGVCCLASGGSRADGNVKREGERMRVNMG